MILLLGCSGTTSFAQSGTGLETSPVSAEEKKLYDSVMAYRASRGRASIPLSKSLTHVAKVHVMDLETNQPNKGICNLHSWSDKGPWTPCCYTADHAKASFMWSKPRELTTYPGQGYEIAHSHSDRATAAGALKGWIQSPAHHNVILNQDIWQRKWNAIGIGIQGKYAVIWFGNEIDPAGPPQVVRQSP